MDLWFAVLVREACWSIFIAMIAGTTKTCREQHLEQRKRRYMYVKLYNAFHKNILRILFCPQASILLKTHPKIYPEFNPCSSWTRYWYPHPPECLSNPSPVRKLLCWCWPELKASWFPGSNSTLTLHSRYTIFWEQTWDLAKSSLDFRLVDTYPMGDDVSYLFYQCWLVCLMFLGRGIHATKVFQWRNKQAVVISKPDEFAHVTSGRLTSNW